MIPNAVQQQELTPVETLEPFLIADRERLAGRIRALRGPWLDRWQRFLTDAALDGGESSEPPFPLHAALAFVVSGDSVWAEAALRNLRWLAGHYPRLVARGLPDTDTWMHAAPMARRAISLDWMWDCPEWNPGEREALAELFITDALCYPYTVLHHRVPAHANNQGLAQALCLVVVGYLFGWRRQADRRARHLMRFGLGHLFHQLSALPRGAYASEGSTYAVGIEAPLAALACATLEAISGREHLHQALEPYANSWAQVLHHARRFVAPSGLLLPWNQYGYQSCWPMSTSAYLASRGGDKAAARELLRGERWDRSAWGPWMADDHVWQWVWMPDGPEPSATTSAGGDADAGPGDDEAWVEPHVGGVLLSSDRSLHLAQYWNWSCSPPGRAHMHPNGLASEAFGSPLLIDGHATAAFAGYAAQLAPLIGPDHPMAGYDPNWWAPGSLGAHSCLIIDGAIDLVSPFTHVDPADQPPLAGRCVGHLREPRLQAFTSDVTDFYRERFADLHSVQRTAALVDDRLWLIGDRVQSDHEHEWVSQFVLRREAQPRPWGLRVRTAEHVVLDLMPLGESSDSLHDCDGLPSVLEQRCHQWRRRSRGRGLERWTVMVPRLGRRRLASWPDGWQLTLLDAGQQVLRAFDAVAWSEVWSRLPAGDRGGLTVRMQRRVQVPAASDARLVLQLPKAYHSRLWIDDQPVEWPRLAQHHHGEPDLLPPFVDVTEALRPSAGREATIRIEITRLRNNGLWGHVHLHAMLEPAPPQVRSEGSHLTIAFDDQTVTVDLDRLAHLPAPSDPPPAPMTPLKEAVATVLAAFPTQDDAGSQDVQQRLAHALDAPADDAPDYTTPQLVGLLDDGPWWSRMLAAKVLGCRGDRTAVPALRAILRRPASASASPQDLNFRVHIFAAWALGRIGDPAATPELAACLAADRYYGLRRVASEALTKLDSPEARHALALAALDRDPEVATVALVALGVPWSRRHRQIQPPAANGSLDPR